MQNEARNDQGNKIIRSNTAANNFFIKQDQSLKASAFGTYTRTSRGCNPPPPAPRTSTSKLSMSVGSWSYKRIAFWAKVNLGSPSNLWKIPYTHFDASSSMPKWFVSWPGGSSPLYKLYRYVPPHRVGFLRHFGLKTGTDFANLVWNRVWFIRGNYDCVLVVSIPNE